VEPKSDRSRRTVRLPVTVVESLRRHRARQNRERLAAGDAWRNTLDLVFTTPIGTPLDSANVTHTFQRHLAAAGLPRKRFHDLRHTCASLLLASGEQPLVVSRMLGHHLVQFTLDTYGHPMPGRSDGSGDRIEQLLGAL
jgi:integrase